MAEEIVPTPHERLMLARRREGLTQPEAARKHRVPLSRYSAWERGLIEHVPKVRSRKLQPHELCLLYRRRCGMSQAEVAQQLGCSRWWVNQMERGVQPCDDLLWFWEQ